MKRFLYIIVVLYAVNFSLFAIDQALSQVGTCDPSNCVGPCWLNGAPGMCANAVVNATNIPICNCFLGRPIPPAPPPPPPIGIGQAQGTCNPNDCAGPCILNAIPGMCLDNGMECNCIISTPQPPNLLIELPTN